MKRFWVIAGAIAPVAGSAAAGWSLRESTGPAETIVLVIVLALFVIGGILKELGHAEETGK